MKDTKTIGSIWIGRRWRATAILGSAGVVLAGVVLAGVVLAGVVLAGTTAARAENCDDLSYRRNLIYKNAGYCFKTQAQINNFGNAGCQFDDQADVPLSANQRAEIAAIVRRERMFGCR